MSETYTLPRTGDRALSFEGALLAESDSKTHQGPCENRWWDLALYKTTGGRYALAIGYRTQWQGEHNTDTVLLADSADDLSARIAEHDPLAGMHGYPSGHEERQAALVRTLTACWKNVLSEVLRHVEAERVE